MKTIVIFSKILYLVLSTIFTVALVVVLTYRKKGGFRDGVLWLTLILTCFCGGLVNALYFFSGRPLSGFYVVHLSFSVISLFLRRMFSVGRSGLMIPCLVTVTVFVGVILSLSYTVSIHTAGPALLIMALVLLILIGRIVWRMTDVRAKFEATVAVREWVISLVDIMYYVVLYLIASLGFNLGRGDSWKGVIVVFICVVLLFGLLAAMWMRWRKDRVFLLFPSREDAFIGTVSRSTRSIYVNNEEFGLSGENLFIRLKEYFDEKMPYLDPELTLNDVAKSLLTNKVYLSRAINDFTGQNFCQFVNLYRVQYAVRLFQCNNAYKITDLAARSGFNTERSFAMAFRLYMNISPSRWCRQNRGNSFVNVLRN